MLKVTGTLLMFLLSLTSTAWSASLSEQFSDQQTKKQEQVDSQKAGVEAQLLGEVRESLSTFLETFNGKPRMIVGEGADQLFKTGSTFPVGYLLDGNFILRLETPKKRNLGAPSYKRYNVPRLAVVGRINADGSAELIDKEQVVRQAEFRPHPKTIAKDKRGNVKVYIKSENSILQYNWWVSPVYETAPLVTKYYSSWAVYKVYKDLFPSSVIGELEAFHRDYTDFCRYYFQGKFASQQGNYCRPW